MSTSLRAVLGACAFVAAYFAGFLLYLVYLDLAGGEMSELDGNPVGILIPCAALWLGVGALVNRWWAILFPLPPFFFFAPNTYGSDANSLVLITLIAAGALGAGIIAQRAVLRRSRYLGPH